MQHWHREGAGKKKTKNLWPLSLLLLPISRQTSQSPVGRSQPGRKPGDNASRNHTAQGTKQAKREEWVLGGERMKSKISILLWFSEDSNCKFILISSFHKRSFNFASYLLIYQTNRFISYPMPLFFLSYLLFNYICNNPEFNCSPYNLYHFYQAFPEPQNSILIN